MTVECIGSQGGIVGCYNYMTKVVGNGSTSQQQPPAATPLANSSSGTAPSAAGDSSGSSGSGGTTPSIVGAVVGGVVGGEYLCVFVCLFGFRSAAFDGNAQCGDGSACIAVRALQAWCWQPLWLWRQFGCIAAAAGPNQALLQPATAMTQTRQQGAGPAVWPPLRLCCA